jgi:hypothetical protein
MNARLIPVTYAVSTEKTSPIISKAFAHGCGGMVWRDNSLRPGPVAIWGSPARWGLIEKAIQQGRELFYMDHAYFGRRTYYRITRNAFQHDGTGDAGPERFDVHNRPVQPWREDGRHILICPNSPTYHRLFGVDVHEWVTEITRTIAGVSQRPVRVRWKGQETPIDADLQDCWAVVTFSSAAALDALIAGVPVFVLAPFAAAYRFGLPDVAQIESPIYPDGRARLMWNLAANQWTLDEIRAGAAWRALKDQAVLA